eukprot:14790378-Alexandrium_andersonii.AAC.1
MRRLPPPGAGLPQGRSSPLCGRCACECLLLYSFWAGVHVLAVCQCFSGARLASSKAPSAPRALGHQPVPAAFSPVPFAMRSSWTLLQASVPREAMDGFRIFAAP